MIVLSKSERTIMKAMSERIREYYKTHPAWNKGRPWPMETREKIRQGHLLNTLLRLPTKIHYPLSS